MSVSPHKTAGGKLPQEGLSRDRNRQPEYLLDLANLKLNIYEGSNLCVNLNESQYSSYEICTAAPHKLGMLLSSHESGEGATSKEKPLAEFSWSSGYKPLKTSETKARAGWFLLGGGGEALVLDECAPLPTK